MPIIAYACKSDHVIKKYFRRAKDAAQTLECSECSEIMKITLSVPTSSSKITVDNGVQARAVEILPNIVELTEERANKNYREEE